MRPILNEQYDLRGDVGTHSGSLPRRGWAAPMSPPGVADTDNKIVIVHTEHFASQGALLPNWLSGDKHSRGALGLQARDAVRMS